MPSVTLSSMGQLDMTPILQGVAGPDKDGGATGHPTSIPSPGTDPQNISCFKLFFVALLEQEKLLTSVSE